MTCTNCDKILLIKKEERNIIYNSCFASTLVYTLALHAVWVNEFVNLSDTRTHNTTSTRHLCDKLMLRCRV